MTGTSASPGPRDVPGRTPHRIEGPVDPAAARCHLVVGFDGHRSSAAALTYAIGLAARLGAFLHIAHIIDTDDLPIDPDSAEWENDLAAAVERERRAACALLAHTSSPWAYYSRRGRPARQLAELADTCGAEMIIIGTARGGLVSLLQRLLGESVSSNLTHRTHRPVLLVPEPAAAHR